MPARSNLLRLSAVYSIANVLSAGVPFILLPVLTRALTPAQYGEVISFYMISAICSAFAGLSLQAAVGVRWLELNNSDPRRYTYAALLIAVVTTVVTAIAAALIAPTFVSLAPWACGMAAVSAGALSIQSMRFSVWQSQSNPFPAAALQVGSATLNITFSLLGVFALGMGGSGRIGGAAMAGFLVALLSIYLLIQRREAMPELISGDIAKLLRFGVPLIPHVLAGAFLANADRIVVSTELGAATLGVYGTAAQLGQVIGVLADAMVKALTPTLYTLLGRNSIRDRLRFVGIAYLSVPVWLGIAIALWAFYKFTGSFLLDARYLRAVDVSLWFLLGGAFSAMYLNVAGLFFFKGRTEWISVATLTAAATALILSIPAVQHFGVTGGALSFMASQFVLLCAALALSIRMSPMPWSRMGLAFKVLIKRPRRRHVLAHS